MRHRMDQASSADVRRRLTPAEHRKLQRRVRLRRELTGWMFLAPMFLFFVVFLLIPVIGVIHWSLLRGSIVSETQFVGAKNYAELPTNPNVWESVEHTLIFAFTSVPITLVASLAVALLLAPIRRGGAVYRFLLYFPVLVPGVVSALVWIFLTNADFGVFNEGLRLVGLKPQVWLGINKALGVLIALDVWRNVGYWAMFFVAAIIGFPEELYQAARLDGASAVARFRFLTLPLLRRIIFFAVLVSTIWALQIFDTVVVLTSGGPGTATTTAIYLVWKYVFATSGRVGIAAAISVVLIAVILVLTIVQMLLLRNKRGIA